jgi:hypothetical protein
MSVCVYSAFALSCVQVAALRRADHLSKESYRLRKKDYETEEEARAQQRAVESLNEWMNERQLIICKLTLSSHFSEKVNEFGITIYISMMLMI